MRSLVVFVHSTLIDSKHTWCAAVSGRAGGRISRSRSSDKASLPGECAGAETGRTHWRRTWCSEGTCGALLPCGTWSVSACPTWRRTSADTLYICKMWEKINNFFANGGMWGTQENGLCG